jgi:hypothetical protein
MGVLAHFEKADAFKGNPYHKSAYSVFGGIVSVVVLVSIVFYVSYELLTREDQVVTVAIKTQTGGQLFPVTLVNLAGEQSNLTYTFPPSSPCFDAINASPWAAMLEWTDESPGVLPPFGNITVPICQQRTLFQGQASLEAVMHGLSVLSIYRRISGAWVVLRQDDGTATFLSRANFGYYVPVRLGRTRRLKASGEVTSSEWIVHNLRGAAPIDPFCFFQGLPLAFNCDRFMLSLDDSLTDVKDVALTTSPVDWFFSRLFVTTLIFTVGGRLKLMFRKGKKFGRWLKER